jgi:cell wall-associated NlpC family hydrolase
MARFVLAALLLSSFLVGCTPMPRFTNPPGDAPISKPHERPMEPKQNEPIEQRQETLSRIDQDKMNHIIAGYMTTPYQRGGSGVLGLDCSGFLYVVYRDYDGTRLPLTVESLYRLEDRVQPDDLSYGDLVFFRADGRKVSHVGIYINNGKFVHASETRGVAIDDLTTDTFASEYAGARRIK